MNEVAILEKPLPGSIWKCPCGYEGNWGAVCGHRKGWKSRPQCKGKIWKVRDSADDEPQLTPPTKPRWTTDQPPPDLDTAGTPLDLEPEPEQPDTRRPSLLDEWYPNLNDFNDEPEDPEALAQRLNRQQSELPADVPVGGDEEWSVEPPAGPPKVSSAKEFVALPVTLRVWYDWYRQHGWHQGDGSIGAWITDMLLDHITNCSGLAIVIVNREEVGLLEPATAGA
ncbi:MAG: hypothetical protein C4542_09625 [Dehalococcoidia bacterium]|nr:MAG: hypothetical protein C4542_09625 [Dehalococcoidia bacterium]